MISQHERAECLRHIETLNDTMRALDNAAHAYAEMARTVATPAHETRAYRDAARVTRASIRLLLAVYAEEVADNDHEDASCERLAALAELDAAEQRL